MEIRTDLALEAGAVGNIRGVCRETVSRDGFTVHRMMIGTADAAKRLGKPVGKYITLREIPDNFRDEKTKSFADIAAEEIASLLPEKGCILVAGVGNPDITADSLGPLCAGKVIATRHLRSSPTSARYFEELRSTAVIAPGVLGQTGIDILEMIRGIAPEISPGAVIAVDALAARDISHLGKTLQISDSGMIPGSGIGNRRMELSRKTLGIPVIGIGVPTVVDAATFSYDLTGRDISGSIGEGMTVTPGNIDVIVRDSSAIIGTAINLALHRSSDRDTIISLMS